MGSVYGNGKESCELEVSVEWNDVYIKMCIRMGEFVFGQLSGKTHTNVTMH